MPATVQTGRRLPDLAPGRDGAHPASPGRTATGKGSDATQISSSSECKYCSTPTAEARGYEVLQLDRRLLFMRRRESYTFLESLHLFAES